MLQSKPRVCVWVCVCVCASVRLCVCGSAPAQTVVSILLKLCTKDLTDISLCLFFSFFENSNLMTSWRPFCSFPMGHSHGRNFALIFFKFEYKVQSCSLLFAIWNEQNRLTTFHAITEQKNLNFSKRQKFSIGTRNVSFYTNSDPLKTNLKLFSRFIVKSVR